MDVRLQFIRTRVVAWSQETERRPQSAKVAGPSLWSPTSEVEVSNFNGSRVQPAVDREYTRRTSDPSLLLLETFRSWNFAFPYRNEGSSEEPSVMVTLVFHDDRRGVEVYHIPPLIR